jgi:hypothetical protein
MTRRRWLDALRLAVYTAVLGVLLYRLWHERHDLAAGLAAVGPIRCGVALGFTLAGLWLGMLGWRVLVTATGTRLGLPVASRLYFVAGLGKYLPGGLWPALAQADLARTLRLPPVRLAMAFLGSVALSIGAGLSVGLLAVPRLVTRDAAWWAVLPVAALALLPVFVPRLGQGVLGLARRLVRRGPSPAVVPHRGALLHATALMALGWLVTGVHVVVLAGGFGVSGVRMVPLVVGGFALAAVAGIAAVVMPAGLGIREAVLALTLGAVLDGGALFTVVALSRVLMTLADLLAAAAVTVTAPVSAPATAPRDGYGPAR